ncbi:hypothetical protein [Azospirillum halopraeferens]|uniref:hypothetical protein n=1 Tax=Azospirillum halopraeferens TaxID=34010 RepID=UPI0003F92C22|nr:hypothetical protein [Azospirillum halopraeferens]
MDFPENQPIVVSLLKPVAGEVEGRIDLGDERAVELLVRTYVDRCLNSFQQAIAGSATQDDAVDDIYRLASALNTVFLGASGFDEVIVHPWNAPDQLGVFLRDTLAFDFPPEECVRATLIHMATHIMQALQGNKDDWRDSVDGLVIEVRDLLLGRAEASDDVEPPPGFA